MLPLRSLLPLCWPSRRQLTYRLALCMLAAVPFCGIAHADGLLCPSDVRSGQGPFAKETRPSLDAVLHMTSDRAILGVDGNATLHGNVIVRQDDREVRADQAHYDRAANALTMKGSVTYQDPIVRLSGSDGKYSPAAGAQVKSAQFDLRQRAGHGSAGQIDLTPKGILNLQDVTFTTCRLPDRSWQLHARTLKLDTRQQVGTGRDASVDFQGIPIMYLPWFSFPLSNERKSGFLFPSTGNSSLSGFEFELPYYWNIAPNADLTFSPMYYSRRGVDLAGDARFLSSIQNGDLQWHYLPSDQLTHSNRSFETLQDVAYLPANLRVNVNAANVSDPLYFEDFGTGPETTSTAFLQRLVQVSYRDEYWNLGAEAEQYQPVDVQLLGPDYLPDIYRPYSMAPRLYASGDFGWGPSQLFRYGFDSEVVDFTRAVGITGWRVDLMPKVGLDYEDPGYFIRANVDWRYTQYQLQNILRTENSSPSRSLPITSFDTGLKFDRLLGKNGDRTLTLEPRMLYVYVPYRNQDQLPLFDTAIPDLNMVELFRTNRYVGADRVSDADQVTVGVTSRLLDTTSGQQFLTATLGQAYYIKTPRVQLPGENLYGQQTSDLVGEFVVSAYQNWNVNLNLDYNPAQSQEERTFVQLQYKPAPESVINVAYRYQRYIVLPSALATPGEAPIAASGPGGGVGVPGLGIPGIGVPEVGYPAVGAPGVVLPSLGYGQNQSLNQADFSGAWPVYHNWHLLARMVYDLDAHMSLDRLAGFEYRACCWRIRLIARRYLISGTGQQDTAFIFQLQLSGLAGIGPATDAFLGSAIRGYSPPTSSP